MNLKDEFPQNGLAQVQSSVDDHGAELDEQHHQEGLGNLVLRQGGRYVCCSTVLLNRTQDELRLLSQHLTFT